LAARRKSENRPIALLGGWGHGGYVTATYLAQYFPQSIDMPDPTFSPKTHTFWPASRKPEHRPISENKTELKYFRVSTKSEALFGAALKRHI
jgi:hypothetical protein